MDAYHIALPAKVIFGVGTVDIIGDEANRIGAKHACIITDPGVFQAGLTEPVKERLSKAGLSVAVCPEAEPEPTIPKINTLADELRKQDHDLLVAVGGGSSIDSVKILSVLLTHGGKCEDYAGLDKVPGPTVPVFALPTTAGTGSEATRAGVYTDVTNGQKLPVNSFYMIPRLALVDPTLTYGCPQKVTVGSGIDALVHAVEAYTCNKAHSFSDALALEAMRLIMASLRAVVKDGSNKEARNRMAEGALLAGIAFINSGVAAVHAFAHLLGARYHVPHGVANGLLLPYIMEFSLSANLPRYATIAAMLGVDTKGLSLQEAAAQGVEAARVLAKDIGIPLRLRDVGVPKEALADMTEGTMEASRILSNNPRKLTKEDVRHIWASAW